MSSNAISQLSVAQENSNFRQIKIFFKKVLTSEHRCDIIIKHSDDSA